MGINTETIQNLNPDLLSRVDQELLNRLASVLSDMKTVEIRNDMLAGLQVTGDIKEYKGTLDEPLIHVEATLAMNASVITLTLVTDDITYYPTTATRMSQEQRLHLAFASDTFNRRLNDAFGVQVDLNDLLKTQGSFSFIFDPREFDREQGGIEDLSRPVESDSTTFRDL